MSTNEAMEGITGEVHGTDVAPNNSGGGEGGDESGKKPDVNARGWPRCHRCNGFHDDECAECRICGEWHTQKGCAYLKPPHLRRPRFRGDPPKRPGYNEMQAGILAAAVPRPAPPAPKSPAPEPIPAAAVSAAPQYGYGGLGPPQIQHITMGYGSTYNFGYSGGGSPFGGWNNNRRGRDNSGKSAGNTDRVEGGRVGKKSKKRRNKKGTAACDDRNLGPKEDPNRKDEGRGGQAPAGQVAQ